VRDLLCFLPKSPKIRKGELKDNKAKSNASPFLNIQKMPRKNGAFFVFVFASAVFLFLVFVHVILGVFYLKVRGNTDLRLSFEPFDVCPRGGGVLFNGDFLIFAFKIAHVHTSFFIMPAIVLKPA